MKHNFRIKKYKMRKDFRQWVYVKFLKENGKKSNRHFKCLDTKYKRLANQYREFYKNLRYNFNTFTNIAKNEVEIAYGTTERMFKTLFSLLIMIGIINFLYILFIK